MPRTAGSAVSHQKSLTVSWVVLGVYSSGARGLSPDCAKAGTTVAKREMVTPIMTRIRRWGMRRSKDMFMMHPSYRKLSWMFVEQIETTPQPPRAVNRLRIKIQSSLSNPPKCSATLLAPTAHRVCAAILNISSRCGTRLPKRPFAPLHQVIIYLVRTVVNAEYDAIPSRRDDTCCHAVGVRRIL